jgi:hypothetical protein
MVLANRPKITEFLEFSAFQEFDFAGPGVGSLWRRGAIFAIDNLTQIPLRFAVE